MRSSKAYFLTLVCGIAFFGFFASCNQQQTGKTPAAKADKNAPHAGEIAYVNLDSLEVKYEFFKKKKAEFEQRQQAMQAEITRLAQSLQIEYGKLQEKAQKGAMTQSEGEAAQQKLMQMQKNVENRRESLGTQLMKDQQAFQEELQKRLDNFLENYNKDKGYAYILSYVNGGSILFADKSFDITNDVIEGMNREDKNNPPADDSSDAVK